MAFLNYINGAGKPKGAQMKKRVCWIGLVAFSLVIAAQCLLNG